MLSMTGPICSKMPQEYKDDPFPPQRMLIQRFISTDLASSFSHPYGLPYILGAEKSGPPPTLISLMKGLILTHLLPSSTVIYPGVLAVVCVSPGAAQSPTYTPLS